MASLLPLLHDLLPIFLPAEVRVARGVELVPVEERAERPPWYQQQPTPQADTDVGAESDGSAEAASQSAELEPIQLLDYEGSPGTVPGDASGEQGTGAHASVRDGPKVFRKNAMVGVSDKMCVTVLTVRPQSATAIHHHGEQDVIIHANTPGVLLLSRPLDPVEALRADIKGQEPTSEDEQPRRLELGPGDFVFVPAWTEHQVVNEAMEGDVDWVLCRHGAEPIQVDLDDWGGRRIKT